MTYTTLKYNYERSYDERRAAYKELYSQRCTLEDAQYMAVPGYDAYDGILPEHWKGYATYFSDLQTAILYAQHASDAEDRSYGVFAVPRFITPISCR